jgi:hypothetical protein
LAGLNSGAKNGTVYGVADFSTIWTSNQIADQYRNYQHLWNPTTNSTDVWLGSAARLKNL